MIMTITCWGKGGPTRSRVRANICVPTHGNLLARTTYRCTRVCPSHGRLAAQFFFFRRRLDWFSEDQLTQSNPFCTSIISSYQITRGHILTTSSSRMGIVLKEEHMLADVSATMSSELRRHCNHYFIFLKLFTRRVPIASRTAQY